MGIVVFDVDGTIFKNNNAATQAFADTVYEMYGIKEYSKQWSLYKRCSDIGIIREICGKYLNHEMTWDEVLEFENLYLKKFSYVLETNPESLMPVEGIYEFIQKCKTETELKIAIYTGGIRRVTLMKLAQIGIYESEFPIATAQDGLHRCDIYSAAISKAKVMYDIEQTDSNVIIGDSELDIKLVKQLEIPLIGVTTSLSAQEFNEYGVKVTIKDFQDIDGVIEKINYLCQN